jgi:hypothetical protein
VSNLQEADDRLRECLNKADTFVPRELPPGMISDMKVRLAFHMMLDENLRALADELTKVRHQLQSR